MLRSESGCSPVGLSLSHSPQVKESLQLRSQVHGTLSSLGVVFPRSQRECSCLYFTLEYAYRLWPTFVGGSLWARHRSKQLRALLLS